MGPGNRERAKPAAGLTLPEPARTVWLAHRDELQRVADEGDPPHRMMLHGGTVLAARWRHRESVDVDVLVPDREDLFDLWGGSPDDAEARFKGRIRDSSESQIKIETESGIIDIASIRPPLPGREQTEDVEGRPQITLATVQILTGKLQRVERTPARDAVDYIIAAKKDPAALEAAVNRFPHRRLETMAANFEHAKHEVAEEARNAVSLREEWRIDPEDTGELAASNLKGHLYRRVTVEYRADRITVHTICRNGRENDRTYEAAQAASGLNRDGLATHLAAEHRMGLGRLMVDITHAIRDRRARTLFDSGGAGGHVAPERAAVEVDADAHLPTWRLPSFPADRAAPIRFLDLVVLRH